MTQAIKLKIAELSQALEAGDSSISSNILWIHKQLQETPESIHLLSEDEIATIIKGFSIASGNNIVAPVKKGTKSNLKDVEV
jgi:hypothetical protein